jgi:hypothetical protein
MDDTARVWYSLGGPWPLRGPMTWLKRTLLGLVAVAAAALVVGGLVVGSYLNRLASDLPSEEKLVEMAAQVGACAPEDLVHAVIAAEDKEFLDREPFGYTDLFSAQRTASTLTTFLARLLLADGPRRRPAEWAFQEVMLWRRIEAALSRQDIVNLLLSRAYFGKRAFGAELAARIYFDKSCADIDLGEAAHLAAALRQPKRYNLVSDPISAKSRQQYVLREMVECGFANPAQAQAEMNAAIPVVARPSTQLDQPLGESRHPFGGANALDAFGVPFPGKKSPLGDDLR